METAGIRNDSRGDASLHQSTGAHHVDVGMLPNDVGNLLIHTLRLEVNVHEEEVRWMVERKDESRDHDCCRGPCRADVVDDAWIGDLISLAKLHAVERIGIQVGRQGMLFLPDCALERLLTACLECGHVGEARDVVIEVVEHPVVGQVAERCSGGRWVEVAVHLRHCGSMCSPPARPRAPRDR